MYIVQDNRSCKDLECIYNFQSTVCSFWELKFIAFAKSTCSSTCTCMYTPPGWYVHVYMYKLQTQRTCYKVQCTLINHVHVHSMYEENKLQTQRTCYKVQCTCPTFLDKSCVHVHISIVLICVMLYFSFFGGRSDLMLKGHFMFLPVPQSYSVHVNQIYWLDRH